VSEVPDCPARGVPDCSEYAVLRSKSSCPRRISRGACESVSLVADVTGGSGDERAEAAGDAGQRAPREGAVLAGERNGFEYVDARGSRSRNESFEEMVELLREEAAIDGAGRKVDAEVEDDGE